MQQSEQSINNVLMLKSFAQSIGPLYEALARAQAETLVRIREFFRPEKINPIIDSIKQVINEDVTYQKTPLDLRNQRTYAVKVVAFPCMLHLYSFMRLAETFRTLVLMNFSPGSADYSMSLVKLSKKPRRTFINMSLTSTVSLAGYNRSKGLANPAGRALRDASRDKI